MLLAQRASQRQLAQLSRNLGVSLHSGIDILKCFEMAARKQSGKMTSVLLDIVDQLRSGSDVTAALESQGTYFPDLFVDMVQVGESTGNLPEVLRALGTHYENNLRLRRDFLSRMMFPAVQLLAAICIIAGVIYLLGWIADMTGSQMDPVGLGLIGTKGALVWLSAWGIGLASLVIVYKLMGTSLSGLKTIHRLLLGIPVVGNCMRAFAIARFSWAFHLTQQAGMPIDESLESSLRATSNGAFIAASGQMIADINNGESLTEAMENTGLFPEDFLQMVHVAETSGTVPEALDRLSPHFEEDARRSMQTLATVAGWVIRSAVALVIIFFIFRFFLWYVGLLDSALKGL